MSVKFSCLVDKQPRFLKQVLVWACSLLTFGAQDASSLVIHTVGECHADAMRLLASWGIETRVVERFDTRHPPSNKLAQLESEALHSADYVVLSDCDVAFCGPISPWIVGDSIRARTAAWGGLPPESWVTVFRDAGLQMPSSRVQALVTGRETLPSYCNGGLYIFPQAQFQRLREVWPRWDRWLLDRGDLGRMQYFIDQLSFAMSCEELAIDIDHLPLELNFDTVYIPLDLAEGVNRQAEIEPMVLHYHGLDATGRVPLTDLMVVNRGIRKINDLMRFAKRVNFDKAAFMLLQERRPFDDHR